MRLRSSNAGTRPVTRPPSGPCSTGMFPRCPLSSGVEGMTDFDHWLVEQFAEPGAFTTLVVLVDIDASCVTPLRSTHFNVIGTETSWAELSTLFMETGDDWDGVSFFPLDASDGELPDNQTAQQKLRELEARLDDDRLVLNEGHFFDKWGRRMRIDEVQVQ